MSRPAEFKHEGHEDLEEHEEHEYYGHGHEHEHDLEAGQGGLEIDILRPCWYIFRSHLINERKTRMQTLIPGNLLTTAMAVMPHTDVGRALETALSLDVPFWPQLPNYNYYEDMYVQAAEHFPGIVLDLDERPILFDDTVRPFMLEFMAKRLNVQLARLKEKNANAFMFVDEPGLQFLFSAMAGYSDLKAKGDLDEFFARVDRPRGIHLCGNPDWDFLLNMDLDVLSMDLYTNAEVFASYAGAIGRFLDRGGVIVWGIVPTGFEVFAREESPSLIARLEMVWKLLWSKGVDRELLVSRSMLSPATCCLVNPDKEKTVERAFATVKQMSAMLRDTYL